MSFWIFHASKVQYLTSLQLQTERGVRIASRNVTVILFVAAYKAATNFLLNQPQFHKVTL